MRIQHNIAALNAHRQLGINNAGSGNALEKLSSGFRINRAADDAAGLAISEKMRGQVRGLTQATRNAQDGISLVQTAEGATQEIHSMLQRMRELAVQAATQMTEDDRGEIQKEINQLVDELDRIVNETQFNKQVLLDGEFAGIFHVGANQDQQIELNIENLSAETLNVRLEADGDTKGEAISVASQEDANDAIATIDEALEAVSSARSNLGAVQNRLEYTIANLGVTAENLTDAEARIRDVDMAAEMLEFTKFNILNQASIAMLAQANMQPQSVLQLLA